MYEIFEKLLNLNGISAYKVSKATGVSTATLTSWKQGKYQPKREKLKAIADYFGVTMEYLMEGDTALLSGRGNGESAAEKQQELTEDEAELLAIFRYLTDKALLLDYARMLKDREKASGGNALNVG